MNQKIIDLIKEYPLYDDFTYTAPTDLQIQNAQNELNVLLPSDYISFLKTYGHGGLDGFETIGVGKNGVLLFVDETQKYRKLGLPSAYVIVENCDEWIYCINCDEGNIVSWANGVIQPEYDNFDEYFLDRIHDAIENLD